MHDQGPSSREEGEGAPFCDWGWREGGRLCFPCLVLHLLGLPQASLRILYTEEGEAVRVGIPSELWPKKGGAVKATLRCFWRWLFSVYFVYFAAQGREV